MKTLTRNLKFTLLLVFTAVMMFACSREDVADQVARDGSPVLAAALEEAHPDLDLVCQTLDTVYLMAEDGSMFINKCFGPGGIVPCPLNAPKWGFVIVQEGYVDGVGFLKLDVNLAVGWFGQASNLKDFASNGLEFSVAGIPLITNDWSAININPMRNNFTITIAKDDLPKDGLDMVLRISAVKLNMFGQVNNLSGTKLWAKNPHSDQPNNPMFSAISPVVTRIHPQNCLPVPIQVQQVCTSKFIGISELSGGKTLSPDVSGLTGNLSYQWSTGATTASISVAPTSTTVYTVSVSADGRPVAQIDYTVNVSNVACGNGNQNHKVKVCHYPPGNPNNMQEICIDFSGVPAHDANYRPAGSLQGHDSGCHIGACGSNPCE